MEEKKNILPIITICVIIGLCAIGVAVYLINNNNEENNNKPNDTTIIDNNETENIEDETTIDNIEDENTEDEDIEECNNYSLFFKSEKTISKDYSSLLSELDFTNKTAVYCLEDQCKFDESELLTDDMYDSGITSATSDFKAEIKDGKVVITTEDGTITLDNENVISIKAIFNVSDGVNLYMLDGNNNLHLFDKYSKKVEKLYSNVKDFTVFEGNNYISVIEPSEGQNIKIAFHTTDGKLMLSGFLEEDYHDIKKISYEIIHSNNLDFGDIIVSQSKKYTYEKNNGKEIIVKELFISSNRLYIYTSDEELLSSPLDENVDYCNMKYTKVKSSNVKSVTYNDSDKKVTVKFSDGSSETYEYSYRIDI